ncbi:hypothetical protein [Ornithinimicrobium kibberense]|uniref:hypothetical protein n=1 Tax=Ornithinimicrobium kibberense TaxID=282060 RepID=UPI0036237C36
MRRGGRPPARRRPGRPSGHAGPRHGTRPRSGAGPRRRPAGRSPGGPRRPAGRTTCR